MSTPRLDKYVYCLAALIKDVEQTGKLIGKLSIDVFEYQVDKDFYDIIVGLVKLKVPCTIYNIRAAYDQRQNRSRLEEFVETLLQIENRAMFADVNSLQAQYTALKEATKALRVKKTIAHTDGSNVTEVIGKLQAIEKENVVEGYPFDTHDGKSWMPAKKNTKPVEAFRWDCVECEFQLENDRGEVKAGLFRVSGDINGMIEVSNEELNERTLFKKAIVSKFSRNKYIDADFKVMRTIKASEKEEREAMDMMSDYYIKQMENCKRRAKDLPGWGNVSRAGNESRPSSFTHTKWIDFWNFGNKILAKYVTDKGIRHCEVFDYEEVIAIFPGIKAYRFQNFTESFFNDFSIIENPKLKDELQFLYDAWGSAGIMALSWLVYHGFYKYIRESNEKVSILYISGESGCGKTTLAEMLLACCGLHGELSRSVMSINQSQGGISNSAMQKYASHTYSIPLYMDEAEKPEQGQTSRSFMQLLGLFDGTGAKRSKRTADGGIENVIDSPKHAGAIYTGIKPPVMTEHLNRCTLIELPNKHKMREDKFNKHKADISGYSPFLFEVMKVIDHTEFLADVNKNRLHLVNLLRNVKSQAREINSLAGVYTAYKLLVKYGFIRELVTDEEWIGEIKVAVEKRENVFIPDLLVDVALSLSNMKFYDIDIAKFIYRIDYPDRTELNLCFKDGNLAKKICEHYNKDYSQHGSIMIPDVIKNITNSKYIKLPPPDKNGNQNKSQSTAWRDGNYEVDDMGNLFFKGTTDMPSVPAKTRRFYRFVLPVDYMVAQETDDAEAPNPAELVGQDEIPF